MADFTRVSRTVLDTDWIDNRLDENKQQIEDKSNQLAARLENAEKKLLNNSIEIAYLTNRQSNNSDILIETFTTEDYTLEDYESQQKPAEIIRSDVWKESWKIGTETSQTLFKEGFIRPDTTRYMMEKLDIYDLSTVGQAYSGGISRYDSINNCYWLMSNAGLNGIGEITKIAPTLKENKVEVMGRWYLTALGASIFWCGIDVIDGTINNSTRGADEQFIYVTFSNNSTGVSNVGLGKIKINTDSTLGANYTPSGGTLTWADSWSSSDDFTAVDTLTRLASGNYYPDCTVWDDSHIALLKLEDNVNVTLCSLEFIELDDDNAGAFTTSNPRSNITGFENLFVQGANYELSSYTMIRNSNDLWIKVNEYTSNFRQIYKFSFVEATPTSTGGVWNQDVDTISGDFTGYIYSSGTTPYVLKASGRFPVSLPFEDPYDFSIAKEGITIDKYGNFLEISCPETAPNNTLLTKRALRNVLWAENQINGEVPMLTDSYSGDSSVPTEPIGCMVDSNGWYYTTESGNSAQDQKIYRYKLDGTVNSIKVTGTTSLWTNLRDLTTDGTNVWIVGTDGTNVEVIKGTKSYLDTQLDSDTDIDIDDGVNWTHSTGVGTSNTDDLYGICYDSDNTILYLINDTDDKIDTLSTDGVTWTQGVYDLPAPVVYWFGIAYKNNKIFIGDDAHGTGVPSYTQVIDLTLSTSTQWYRLHLYQDPSYSYSLAGKIRGMDFHGNDLVITNKGALRFYKIKILEDPDVMQLHTFIDSNNVLMSSAINSATPIAKRYFDPEDFTEYLPVTSTGTLDMSGSEHHWENIPSKRNVPDLYYMAVGYFDEGISVLHLDTFLAGKSSTGKDRRDVRDIREWHFNVAADNLMRGTGYTASVAIEKDIIFRGNTGGALVILDLKSGHTTYSYPGSVSGFYYNGTVTERNQGKGTTGTYNPLLDISNNTVRGIHAVTFTKDDISAYNGTNPKTCVMLATGSGCDILFIDWDSNNNRTPVRVFNNLFNVTNITRAVHLTPDGYLFGGNYDDGADLYRLTPPYKAWDITTDTIGNTMIWATDEYFTDISPNSLFFKTLSGDSRHVLLIGGIDGTGSATLGALTLFDIENQTTQFVWDHAQDGASIIGVDNFEDKIYHLSGIQASAGYHGAIVITKRVNFNDYDYVRRNDGTVVHNKDNTDSLWDESQHFWTAFEQIRSETQPRFSPDCDYTSTSGDGSNAQRCINYSNNGYLLESHGLKKGIMFHHFWYLDSCTHESKEFTTENPSHYYYTQNVILGD